MALRNKLFLACESFLRVPPLLLIDEIFRTSFGLGGLLFKSSGSRSESRTILTESVILNSKVPIEIAGGGDIATFVGAINPEIQEHISNGSTVSSLSSLADYLRESWQRGLELLQNSTLSQSSVDAMNTSEEAIGVEHFSKLTEDFAGDLMFCGQIILSFALFFAAIIMFMLATDNLIKLYSHLLSFLMLYISYVTPPFVLSSNLSDIFLLSMNISFRTVLATVFFGCKSWSKVNTADRSENRIPSYLEPFLLSMFFVSGAMQIQPAIFIVTIVALHHKLIMSLPTIYNFLLVSWGETKRVQNEYGLSHLIQVESGRLRINTVFRLFWMTRAAYDAFYRCCDEPLSLIIKYVMIHGTETFTGIIGLTVTVAAVCHQIGDLLLWLLYYGANNEVDLNRFGSISTVLFFILSLQSGLTSLDPEKRLDRLMKNIALLGTALFHALHQLVAPILHAFRSFQAVQIRAATVSCVFLLFSFCLTFSLLCYSTISTWSLAVLALAIEFKIKVIISLVISIVVYLSQLVQYPEIIEKFVSSCRRILPRFVMHFFDQMYDQVSHEDMVFYLKTVANVAEFITGIFLFLNAVWIFFFESTSAIRAIGMSIHAYFNIWCEAQKGFRIYCQRKTASRKIMSLKDATEGQLRLRSDDVCSICYEGFESAKVTNCGHLFHAVCLRKWLYVQNTCPMCHEILYKEDADIDTDQLNADDANDGEPLPEEIIHDIRDREIDNGNIPNNNVENPLNPLNLPSASSSGANNVINPAQLRHQNGQLRVAGVHNGVAFPDGNETDVEGNELLYDVDEEDGDSFVELEDLEMLNRELDRGDEPDRDGGVHPANGRGLYLLL